MPVFDFNDEPKEEKKAPECTYTVIRSNETGLPRYPILVLDNSSRKMGAPFLGCIYKPGQKNSV